MSALADALRGLSDSEACTLLRALPKERVVPIARALDDDALFALIRGPGADGGAVAPVDASARPRSAAVRGQPAAAAKPRGRETRGRRIPGRVDAVLAYVAEHPGSTTTELTAALGYSRSTSTANVLRRLVAAGRVRQENVRAGKARVAHWYPAGRAKSASPRKAALPAAEEEE